MIFPAIAFPSIDPVAFSLGPVDVHWYGLAYVVGILIGWRYARSLAANERLWGGAAPFRPEDIDDFLTYAVIGIVAGGRLGYVLFYEPAAFLSAPWRIFAIWTGGMSFHGGLAGTIAAMIAFARLRRINVYSLFDAIAASVGPGIFLGRLANFINQELWGKPSDLPWAVVFPAAGPEPRHPSQIYEAMLEGLALFLVLRLLTHRSGRLRQPGFVAGAFLVWYGASRVLVEFFRLPDAQIGYLLGGWLTMGMVLSAPFVILGLWLMAGARGRTISAGPLPR